VAAGGTNGWFPDGVGNKPWVDQSATAMRDFAFKQSDWVQSWPTDPKERGMAVCVAFLFFSFHYISHLPSVAFHFVYEHG